MRRALRRLTIRALRLARPRRHPYTADDYIRALSGRQAATRTPAEVISAYEQSRGL